MNTDSLFEQWRSVRGHQDSWGLTWYLSLQICKRYYGSHGLVPWVILHEGLGYYGISLNYLPCSSNKGLSGKPIGRFSITGRVENCLQSELGSTKYKLDDLCAEGASTDELTKVAIRYLGLSSADAFKLSAQEMARLVHFVF